MNQKLITIVVPAYNSEKYIQACVESIFAQSYKKWELLLIDDGSDDCTGTLCDKLAEKDGRIRVFHQENQGVSAARNRGISEANGEYICFIDADDLVKPDCLMFMYERMLSEDGRIQAIYCGHDYLYGKRVLKRSYRWENGCYSRKQLENIIIDDGTLTGILLGSVCGALYDLNFIRNEKIFFDEKIKRNEDGIFNIRVVLRANEVCLVQRADYLYRQDEDRKATGTMNIVKKMETEFEKSSKVLAELGFANGIKNIECQLRRRQVSETNWLLLRVSQTAINWKTLIQYTKQKLKALNICEADFDMKKMNRYKKMFLKLYRFHAYIMVAFLLRYIFPLTQKRIRR